MRRLELFSLILACLLTLAACGGEAEDHDAAQSPPDQDPPAQNGSVDVTVFDCGGLAVALPSRYLDLLRVDTDFHDAGESWKPLISVYDKASYEAAEEAFGEGGGFLFGFLEMDQAAFEQHISANGTGMEIFASDGGDRYFAYSYPTDVQFCRPTPGGIIDIESSDWKEWEELNRIGPLVREDFLTRNGLRPFDVQEFLDQRAEAGGYVCVRYYPGDSGDGGMCLYYQLLLTQPARKGEGGVWAVDQWLDEYGNRSFYFPDSGMPSAEYYARLQAECDAGLRPEFLTPAGAAEAFVRDYFGYETAGSRFEQVSEVDYGYMERNRYLQQMDLDLLLDPDDVDGMELLDCIEEATAENWRLLSRYGASWFRPLMDAVSKAAVGQDQQRRDRAVMAFLLAVRDEDADFQTPPSAVLLAQETADPAAFRAALAELSEEDRAYIQKAVPGL